MVPSRLLSTLLFTAVLAPAALTQGPPPAVAKKAAAAPKAAADASRKSAADAAFWRSVLSCIDRGDELVQKGLLDMRHTVRARRSYDAALAQYAAASHALRTVRLTRPDDRAVHAKADRIAARIKERSVTALLHSADALIVQTSYRSALARGGQVLALDPDNADAKSLIRMIQLAQSAGCGFGWGARGGISVAR